MFVPSVRFLRRNVCTARSDPSERQTMRREADDWIEGEENSWDWGIDLP